MREYFELLFQGSFDEYIGSLKENLKNEKKTFVVTANPEAFMFAESDPEVNALLTDKKTSVVADGIGIVKGAAMLHVLTGVPIRFTP